MGRGERGGGRGEEGEGGMEDASSTTCTHAHKAGTHHVVGSTTQLPDH